MIKNVMIVGLTLIIFSMEVSNKTSAETRARMFEESVETLEDMRGWMVDDIEGGEIRKELGVTYLANIDGTIIDLKAL